MEVFKEIGNSISVFKEVNMSSIEMGIMTIGKILAGLDLREGLAKEISYKRDPFIILGFFIII